MRRRDFLKASVGAFAMLPFLNRIIDSAEAPLNELFWIKNIPDQPFYERRTNYHIGIDSLLYLMGRSGLKFYKSNQSDVLSGRNGIIGSNDVVLIKVNAQWKYRGCTNSDLVRGLIQRILDHPDGFNGEVVIFENGQGWGSLNCDSVLEYPDNSVHANANNESHSFLYLIDHVFDSPFVSGYLLDPVRKTFIDAEDHVTDGYRKAGDVSYPCFTTRSGNRVELKEGIWNGKKYEQNLKLFNIPVLKHHDTGGSEVTASLKHTYGIMSMSDGHTGYRHYQGLGETCGSMIVNVRPPVLNIIDAIWVSLSALSGYPESQAHRANQIIASQDPAAVDYWALKYILYPIDQNPRHHPDFSGINAWLTNAISIINAQGGIFRPEQSIFVKTVTKDETHMHVFSTKAFDYFRILLQNPKIGDKNW
jgi:hypothetical protein